MDLVPSQGTSLKEPSTTSPRLALLPQELSSLCLETSGTADVRAGASEPHHGSPH